MPRGSASRKGTKRKSGELLCYTKKYKKAKSDYKNLKKMVKIPLGLSDKMNIRVCYSDLADTLSGAAPTYYGNARFAMTNLVDPDISGTGYQPPLFDNLKLLYQRWIVNSAKVTARVENWTNIPVHVTLVGLYETTTNTPTSPANPSTYDLMALSTDVRSVRKRLNTVQVGNGNSAVLTKTFYPEKIIGPDYYTSVNFAGNGNSAPTNYAVIDLIAQSGDSSVNSTLGLWVSWSIEYDVTFYEKIETEIAAYD